MYPINQVILGNEPILNTQEDLDYQLQKMENYKQKLKMLKEAQNNLESKIWNKIDDEVNQMTQPQKEKLLQDSNYLEVHNDLQLLVQGELLNLVKNKIENSERGKKLLEKQLNTIKNIKTKIIEETNKEINIFNKFKEFSKTNPNITYEDFIKTLI